VTLEPVAGRVLRENAGGEQAALIVKALTTQFNSIDP
jgi:hypothetical protein